MKGRPEVTSYFGKQLNSTARQLNRIQSASGAVTKNARFSMKGMNKLGVIVLQYSSNWNTI